MWWQTSGDGDGERMRSDKGLKIKRQNSKYGAAQIGDSAAVVPLLQKHLNRKSPPANCHLGPLKLRSSESRCFLFALPSQFVCGFSRELTVRAWIQACLL